MFPYREVFHVNKDNYAHSANFTIFVNTRELHSFSLRYTEDSLLVVFVNIYENFCRVKMQPWT